MLTRSRCVATAVSFIAATTLTACTPGPSRPSEPAIDAVPTIEDYSNLSLPLDAYRYSAEGYRSFSAAATALTFECLERFGVVVPASARRPPEDPNSELFGPNFNDRRYGLLDLASAQARGYNTFPSTIEPMDRNDPDRWNPSDNVYFLIEGRSRPEFSNRTLPTDQAGKRLDENGCNGEALKRLTGDTSIPDLNLVNRYGGDSLHLAEADSRVRDVTNRWAECMRRSGYQYSNIWEPNDKNWPEPAGAEEIATAVADVRCKREVNLVGTWYAVEGAYQRRVVEQNREVLKQLERYLETVYREAAEVLSGR